MREIVLSTILALLAPGNQTMTPPAPQKPFPRGTVQPDGSFKRLPGGIDPRAAGYVRLTSDEIRARLAGRQLGSDPAFPVPEIPAGDTFYEDGNWVRSEAQRGLEVIEGSWRTDGDQLCVDGARRFGAFPVRHCREVWGDPQDELRIAMNYHDPELLGTEYRVYRLGQERYRDEASFSAAHRQPHR